MTLKSYPAFLPFKVILSQRFVFQMRACVNPVTNSLAQTVFIRIEIIFFSNLFDPCVSCGLLKFYAEQMNMGRNINLTFI